MSAVAEKVSPILPKLLPAQSFLSGLIAGRRRVNSQNGSLWLTVIKLPAANEFSHPATVEVRSHNPLGEINDKWSGVVSVTGFPRSYNTKPDQETGEIKSVKTAQVALDVVEE